MAWSANRYFHHPQPLTLTFEVSKLIDEKEKRSPVVVDRSLHSHEMFMAVKGPKPNTIVVKVL